ncbi:MAG: glucose-6-phosphate dehydrogenase [Planctomycetia bacterium]|nr:glucose-6-phosphate dehydrogenase [Planctomycetia bacterium]
MACTLIIFGASGDLTSRKLIPAMYQLFRKSRLPKGFRVVGVSRTPLTDEAWRARLRGTTETFTGKDFHAAIWEAFAPAIHYFAGDVTHPEMFGRLDAHLSALENGPADRVFYLSTSPVFYETIAEGLGPFVQNTDVARRVVVEKPFGTNLSTAQHLNDVLHRFFREEQIFRIDHYLGKETAQNVMVFRFANAIFEPLWNRNYIADVQITANEETLVGHRASYYNQAGVLRDMFQNHLMQLLCLVAMEPPVQFDADAIRDEKVKVLRAVRPMETEKDILSNTLRGRYDEDSLDPNVATYAAVRLHIDNWRWAGVPFYLRSGKAMSCRTTQIVLHFHCPPHRIFPTPDPFSPNRLLIQIQPAEGIQIHFQSKVPETDMRIYQKSLQYQFDVEGKRLPDAYQRLLLDALHGDASLFARSDEVEAAWKIIDPIQTAWDTMAEPPFPYLRGSWGPDVSDRWIQLLGGKWFNSCPVLCSQGDDTSAL